MTNIFSYLLRLSWRSMLIAATMSIAGGISGAAMAALLSKAITGSEASGTLAWSFFGVCVACLVFNTCSEIVLLRMTQDAIFQLRVELSRKLLATPMKKLQSLGAHGLLAILTNDISAFIHAFEFVPIAVGNFIVIVCCFVYMAWLSPQLFFFFLVSLTVCLAIYFTAERKPLREMVKVREQTDVLFRHFRDLVEGSKELQMNAQRGEHFVDHVIASGAADFRRVFVKCLTGYAWVAKIGKILFYVVIGLILFVVPLWKPQPHQLLATAALLVLYMVRPISELILAFPVLRQASISLERILQLDATLAPSPLLPVQADPFMSAGPLDLELQGVTHVYRGENGDGQFMLGPVDLRIGENEIIFIVGGNGSGKTTLAMLLLGLYKPETGRILLNGVPVADENVLRYRQRFSAVFADFHLFEQLVAADHRELTSRAEHYLGVLGIAHKVKITGGKFSTLDLSHGQRKRLALLASYLEDRSIYLFDEWAADQDPAFKRVFYTQLLPELKARGKTVIAITHDDAYFHCADRILKLEDGNVRDLADVDNDAKPALHVV